MLELLLHKRNSRKITRIQYKPIWEKVNVFKNILKTVMFGMSVWNGNSMEVHVKN